MEPLVDNVTQLRNHRKYVEGDNTHVNKTIRQQLSQQNAQSGAYCVAIDAARPGTAYIAYGAGGPESSIYREWFNITPKGEGSAVCVGASPCQLAGGCGFTGAVVGRAVSMQHAT